MSNDNFHDLRQELWKADAIIVLGTSLQVYPFNSLVQNRPKHKPIVIINEGRTPYDGDKTIYRFKESISETLEKINQQLES